MSGRRWRFSQVDSSPIMNSRRSGPTPRCRDRFGDSIKPNPIGRVRSLRRGMRGATVAAQPEPPAEQPGSHGAISDVADEFVHERFWRLFQSQPLSRTEPIAGARHIRDRSRCKLPRLPTKSARRGKIGGFGITNDQRLLGSDTAQTEARGEMAENVWVWFAEPMRESQKPSGRVKIERAAAATAACSV